MQFLKPSYALSIIFVLCVVSPLAGDEIDIKKLEVGSAYRISQETPLMANKTVRSSLAAAVEPLAQIPPGGAFRVTAVEVQGGWPWYKVAAITEERRPIGKGYVNSLDLLRQKIEPFGLTTVKVETTKAPDQPAGPARRTYYIAASRDMNYKDPHTQKYVKRREYKVKLAKEMSEEELSEIAEEIVEPVKDANAVAVLFYNRDCDTKGTYTVGKATWAPNGRWEDAGRMNDKELAVETGPPLGSIDEDGYVNYPINKKKVIFIELVELQDQGMTDKESCTAAAKKHGLSLDQIARIGKEGVAKKWPMPVAK
jgi:hypothetical protein